MIPRFQGFQGLFQGANEINATLKAHIFEK